MFLSLLYNIENQSDSSDSDTIESPIKDPMYKVYKREQDYRFNECIFYLGNHKLLLGLNYYHSDGYSLVMFNTDTYQFEKYLSYKEIKGVVKILKLNDNSLILCSSASNYDENESKGLNAAYLLFINQNLKPTKFLKLKMEDEFQEKYKVSSLKNFWIVLSDEKPSLSFSTWISIY